ncbi:MAG: 4Fe-4S binding protein [bacterium]|nr:4Fe-4S binding protein [bacterium]
MKPRPLPWQPIARNLTQLGFLIAVLYAGIGRHLGWRLPTVDAICPFGALEGAWHLIAHGRYLGKLFPSNLVVAGAVAASVLLAGAAFCGWICPLGTLQDWLSRLGRRLRLPVLRVAPAVERRLAHLRFLTLAVILGLTIHATELVFSEVCPYRAIFSATWLFSPAWRDWPAYALAGAILLAALFVGRAWCRFLCPLGAVLSVVSRLSLARVRCNPEACTGCGICRQACPMNLDPQAAPGPAPSCLACLECVRACPRPEALALSCRRPWLLPRPAQPLLPLAAVLVFAGVIALASTTGVWATSGMGQAYHSALASGERLAPEDIRGWMTLADVSRATGVPLEHLYAAGQLPPDLSPTTPLRELEQRLGFETQDARQIVADYYREHPDTRIEPAGPAPVRLRGRTTLDEIATGYGIPGDRLLGLLGLPATTPGSASLTSLGLNPSRVQRMVEAGLGDR